MRKKHALYFKIYAINCNIKIKVCNSVTLLLEGTQSNGVLYGTKEVLKLSREHTKENIWNINQQLKYPAKMEIMFLNPWVVIPVGEGHISDFLHVFIL